jgi:hypothetical protein
MRRLAVDRHRLADIVPILGDHRRESFWTPLTGRPDYTTVQKSTFQQTHSLNAHF